MASPKDLCSRIAAYPLLLPQVPLQRPWTCPKTFIEKANLRMEFMNGRQQHWPFQSHFSTRWQRTDLEALLDGVYSVPCRDLYIGIICGKCKWRQELLSIVNWWRFGLSLVVSGAVYIYRCIKKARGVVGREWRWKMVGKVESDFMRRQEFRYFTVGENDLCWSEIKWVSRKDEVEKEDRGVSCGSELLISNLTLPYFQGNLAWISEEQAKLGRESEHLYINHTALFEPDAVL